MQRVESRGAMQLAGVVLEVWEEVELGMREQQAV